MARLYGPYRADSKACDDEVDVVARAKGVIQPDEPAHGGTIQADSFNEEVIWHYSRQERQRR